MLTEVKIESTDVTSRMIRWKTVELFGQEISTCEITLTKAIWDDMSTLSVGNAITIKRGTVTATDQFIFEGYITSIAKQAGHAIIKGRDKLLDMLKKQVNYSYDKNIDASAGVGSAIAQDLIETHGGMTANVETSSSNLLISKLICSNVSIFSQLKILADIYDYMFYYDPDDSKVHFKPKGFVESGTVLNVGTNIHNLPKWVYDFESCVNKLKVLGAEQIVEDTQTFNGTGAADQENTLAKIPISVVASVGGTIKTPGVEGVTTGTYHYEIDKENKKILWNQSYNPPVGVDNVSITYTRSIPISPWVSDEDSVARYYEIEDSKHFSNIQTLNDAERVGYGYLRKFSTPFISAVLEVSGEYDFDAGDKVHVIDNLQNENRWVVIHKVVRNYPHSADKLYVGDKEWRVADWGLMTMERIKRLEEMSSKNEDLIIIIKFTPKPLKIRKRYIRMNRRLVSGTNLFILGHATYGVLGTSKLGDTDLGAETLMRLMWQDQTVIEDFVDTTFKDASTTATWTGTGSTTFTNGEIAVSEIVYDNAVNIEKATLTADSTTNLTFHMRVDGSNWESVTSGSRHTFSNTGQELEWKATASGNATLTNITVKVEEA